MRLCVVGHRGASVEDVGIDSDRSRLGCVEVRTDGQRRSVLVSIDTQHPHPFDPYGTGGDQPDGLPDASRVPFRIDAIPVLKHARQISF